MALRCPSAQGSGSHQCKGLGLCAQSWGRPWNSTAAGRDVRKWWSSNYGNIWELRDKFKRLGNHSRKQCFFLISHLPFNLLSLWAGRGGQESTRYMWGDDPSSGVVCGNSSRLVETWCSVSGDGLSCCLCCEFFFLHSWRHLWRWRWWSLWQWWRWYSERLPFPLWWHWRLDQNRKKETEDTGNSNKTCWN